MEFPDELLKIIKEFSMPISRPDWKKGSYIFREYVLYAYLIRTIARDYKIRRIVRNFGHMYASFMMMDMDDYADD